MKGPRRRGYLAIAGLGILAVVVGRVWLYSDVVYRQAEVVGGITPYDSEFRALDRYGESPSRAEDPGYPGPGWYAVRSPDSKRVAVTLSWDPGPLPSLVIDRGHIHTVAIWDDRNKALKSVISIMEMDPHSGIAHRYQWSKDSRVLLINGAGRLPEDFSEPVELCLLYDAEADRLYRLRDCPGAL